MNRSLLFCSFFSMHTVQFSSYFFEIRDNPRTVRDNLLHKRVSVCTVFEHFNFGCVLLTRAFTKCLFFHRRLFCGIICDFFVCCLWQSTATAKPTYSARYRLSCTLLAIKMKRIASAYTRDHGNSVYVYYF